LRTLAVNAELLLYLTDFLKSTFLRENTQNRAFYGGINYGAIPIYNPAINHDALNLKLVAGIQNERSSAC
jgi:hypothetical protein